MPEPPPYLRYEPSEVAHEVRLSVRVRGIERAELVFDVDDTGHRHASLVSEIPGLWGIRTEISLGAQVAGPPFAEIAYRRTLAPGGIALEPHGDRIRVYEHNRGVGVIGRMGLELALDVLARAAGEEFRLDLELDELGSDLR